jgi:hypothetical protein
LRSSPLSAGYKAVKYFLSSPKSGGQFWVGLGDDGICTSKEKKEAAEAEAKEDSAAFEAMKAKRKEERVMSQHKRKRAGDCITAMPGGKKTTAVLWLCGLGAAAATNTMVTCTDHASCSLHGDCVNGACVCDPGWGGATCAVAVPTPPPTPGAFCHNRTDCAGHGNCRNDAVCICDPGWGGATCVVAAPTPPPTPPLNGHGMARE